MQLECFVFGSFATNCYVVSEGSEAWIIDPCCATSAEQTQLLRYIEQHQLQVTALIATHGHFDHLWGAPWACKQWNQPVLVHPADIPMAQAVQQQYELFGIPATATPFPVENLQSSIKNLKSPISNVQLLSTPGHTPGSVCLYWEKERILLSGDTLFCMGYGRTDLPGGNTGQLVESLERLFALPSDVQVFPGHGESTTIGDERR